MSDYHAIWVIPAEIIPSSLPRIAWQPISDKNLFVEFLFELPFILTGMWLLFWPGNKQPNRFGEVPE